MTPIHTPQIRTDVEAVLAIKSKPPFQFPKTSNALRPLPIPKPKIKNTLPLIERPPLPFPFANPEPALAVPLIKEIKPENDNVAAIVDQLNSGAPLSDDDSDKKRINWALIIGIALIILGIVVTGAAMTCGILATLSGNPAGIIGGVAALVLGVPFGAMLAAMGLKIVAEEVKDYKYGWILSEFRSEEEDPQAEPEAKPINKALEEELKGLKAQLAAHLKTAREQSAEVNKLREALRLTQQPTRVQVLPDGEATIQPAPQAKPDGGLVERLNKAETELTAMTKKHVHLMEELARKEQELDLLKNKIKAAESGASLPSAILPPPPPPLPQTPIAQSGGRNALNGSICAFDTSKLKKATTIVKQPEFSKTPTPPNDLQEVLKDRLDAMRPSINDDLDGSSSDNEDDAVWVD